MAGPAADPRADIRRLVEAAAGQRPGAVTAQTYLQGWSSFSKPRAVSCDDGHVYVIKGRQLGRATVNEQVVARLGLAIGAPVGEPMLVDVPATLIAIEPQLAHLTPGIAHGTRFLPGHSDRKWIEHTGVAENRMRFSRLAVLYGWAHCGDNQLIYANTAPELVTSVDHGHFFPNGPDWQPGHLQGAGAADVHREIVTGCRLSNAELREALDALEGVNEDTIIRSVAIPPDDWAITIDERIDLVQFLSLRRTQLIAVRNGLN